MKTRWIAAILSGLCLLNSFGFAPSVNAENTFYDAKVYARSTAKPQTIADTFRMPRTEGEFTLVVKNGDQAAGVGQVSSSEIKLNGVPVVRTRDFNKQVFVVEKPVLLELENELEVELRGGPETFLVLSVVGELANVAPVANAGPDQTVYVGDTVLLDGSASTDADGDPLSYEWQFVSSPPGSMAELVDAEGVSPSFTVDLPGEYALQLVVNDGYEDSAPDTIIVTTRNSAPIASAGSDQTLFVGDTATLDGSGSSDVDGDPLEFSWSLSARPIGSGATLSDPAAIDPSFLVDRAGTYEAELIVSDGQAESAPDTVTVTTANSSPVANAGPDQTVFVTERVQLDGSKSSDVDGDLLGFRWSLTVRPDGSEAVLSDSAVVRPTFMVDLPGTYVAQLIVNDGEADSAADTVTVTTKNSPPVADAGEDQSVFVGDTVILDGSASSDVDGDPLQFMWSLVVQPEGSSAFVDHPDMAEASFVVDLPGSYVAQLIVNDGHVNSATDTVSIVTENSRPVADAGPDQSVFVNETVQLDGSGSRDIDGDAVGYRWSITSRPDGSEAELSDDSAVDPSFVVDLPGEYVVQLIVNDGDLDSAPDTVMVSTENSRPEACIEPVEPATVGDLVSLASCSTDADGDPLDFEWSLTSFPEGSASELSQADAEIAALRPDLVGTYVVQLIVSDGALSSDPVTAMVTAEEAVVLDSDEDGLTDDEEATLGTDPNNPDTDGDGLPDGAEVNEHNTSPLLGDTDGDTFPDGEEVGAGSDPLDKSNTPVGEIPPDPGSVAPAMDQTVSTTVYAATAFLYSGPNPIQTGLSPETIEPVRVAVVRGKVTTRDGAPLPGITVTVLDHPEYGQSLTRADGIFDLVVNGGGSLTLTYQRPGFLTVQRNTDVPWQDYVWMPDVVMVAADPAVTTIDLAAPVMQIARGSEVTDEDGVRRATVLFPPGTSAELVLPDGSTSPVSTLNIRATEYTVGPSGPDAMPAILPPTSAYTYAVELAADEAEAAGASSIRFDQPVYFYVEDFIGFPVGSAVPSGYYDREKGQWIASENGRVIKILNIAAGMANVDTDGDGLSDDAGKLAALGVTDEERERLAGLYSSGQNLWRVPLEHFSPIDLNWPYSPPSGAISPSGLSSPWTGAGYSGGDGALGTPVAPSKLNDTCEELGNSVIECQNQVLGERIPLVGTPFTLNYRSSRTPFWGGRNRLTVPLLGDVVPESLSKITLYVEIAGARTSYAFDPTEPNLKHVISWDGKDAYGNIAQGETLAHVTVSYYYTAEYCPVPSEVSNAFGQLVECGSSTIPTRVTRTSRLSQKTDLHIGGWDSRLSAGLGGWSFNIHHAYDLEVRELQLGDGSTRSADSSNVSSVIRTVAGSEAGLSFPGALTVAADGSIYFSDVFSHRIRRIDSSGNITTVAGSGISGYRGDGGPATAARLNSPAGIALAPDGALYIADLQNHRIRRVNPDGIIETVAGTGVPGYNGDSITAKSAQLGYPADVDLDSSGNLYISDVDNYRIRRIGTDGIITTVAGNGSYGFAGDGGPAVDARLGLHYFTDIATAPDGSLYIVDNDNYRIRRVSREGVINTTAGNGTRGFSGDGGPATDAQLNFDLFAGITVGKDGSLFIADHYNGRIRKVRPNGQIYTIAGGGLQTEDNVPAVAAQLIQPIGIAISADGKSLFLAESGNNRILKVVAPYPGYTNEAFLVASDSGNAVYKFDASGRHLSTVNALTGGVIYEFGYDQSGLLARIIDGDGNVTLIQRDAEGKASAIVAPYGQRTSLTINSSGYLEAIASPAGDATVFGYDGPLLTSITDPEGNTSSYQYDNDGRITRVHGAFGGFETFERTVLENGYKVARISPLGRATTYSVERLTNGVISLINAFPSGAQTAESLYSDGSRKIVMPDGTVAVSQMEPDPVFGMASPNVTAMQVRSPGGLELNLSSGRSVVLEDSVDPLSLRSATETITVNQRTVTLHYDKQNNEVLLNDPMGRTVSAIIDDQSRLLSVNLDSALDPILYSYDEKGRLNSTSRGAENWTYTYNELGRVESRTNAAGNALQATYDELGRVSGLKLPSGRTYRYTYDGNGNVASLAMPSGAVHEFSYAARTAFDAYEAPGNENYARSYDPDGNWIESSLPSGRAVSNTYDEAGRLTHMSFDEATVEFGYGLLGSGCCFGNGANSVTRTPAGGEGSVQTIAYEFDSGLIKAMSWSGVADGEFDYTYDENFSLTTITLSSADDVISLPIINNKSGLITGLGPFTIIRNGPIGAPSNLSGKQLNVNYSYNSEGLLSGRAVEIDNENVYEEILVYDSTGLITQKTEITADGAHSYLYDYDLDRQLTTVHKDGTLVEEYTYDINGNRLTALWGSASYDDRDRLTRLAGVEYAYDKDGYLDRRGDDGFIYDTRGSLIEATVAAGVVSYSYDGFGRRVGRTIASSSTQYLYGNPESPLQLTASRDGAGELTYYYYDTNGHLVGFERAGAWYYVASDHLGSPRVITDASGSVVKSIVYDSFGKIVLDSNPSFSLEIGFAGGIADRLTGLVRFGLRDYLPEAGRWAAIDPTLFSGSPLNLYAYVNNNPVLLSDPSGAGFALGVSVGFGPFFGAEVSVDSSGITVCTETGTGFGVSPKVDFAGERPPSGVTQTSEAGWGPASISHSYVTDYEKHTFKQETKVGVVHPLGPGIEVVWDYQCSPEVKPKTEIEIGGFSEVVSEVTDLMGKLANGFAAKQTTKVCYALNW